MEIFTTSDIEAFVQPCCIAFGSHPTRAYIESTTRLLHADRAHVASAEGRIVGAAGAFTHALAVPGSTVTAAAVFGIGVLPSHRRRGVLTKLQEAQLKDIHERGEPIAYLWASEGAIYGRFGYGMASQAMRATIESKGTRLRNAPERFGNVRIIEPNEAYAEIVPIYNRLWKKHPGMFFRSEDWWRLRCLANQELFHVAWRDSAYAIYLVKMNSSFGGFCGQIEVVESLSDSAEGYREIWSYLLSIDLIKTVNASCLPVDHPLILMFEDSRRMNIQVRDGLWVRIVDVEAALKARSFGKGSIVIRVGDALLPHNEGIWRVEADGVSRVTTSPDLVIDIADFGSVYLAGFTFSDLARAGRVHEQVPGSVRTADQIFLWDRKPWCPEIF